MWWNFCANKLVVSCFLWLLLGGAVYFWEIFRYFGIFSDEGNVSLCMLMLRNYNTQIRLLPIEVLYFVVCIIVCYAVFRKARPSMKMTYAFCELLPAGLLGAYALWALIYQLPMEQYVLYKYLSNWGAKCLGI